MVELHTAREELIKISAGVGHVTVVHARCMGGDIRSPERTKIPATASLVKYRRGYDKRKS